MNQQDLAGKNIRITEHGAYRIDAPANADRSDELTRIAVKADSDARRAETFHGATHADASPEEAAYQRQYQKRPWERSNRDELLGVRDAAPSAAPAVTNADADDPITAAYARNVEKQRKAGSY